MRSQFGYQFRERMTVDGDRTIVTLDTLFEGTFNGFDAKRDEAGYRFILTYRAHRPMPDLITQSIVVAGEPSQVTEVFRLSSYESGDGPVIDFHRREKTIPIPAAERETWETDIPAGSAFVQFPHDDALAAVKTSPEYSLFKSSAGNPLETEASFTANSTAWNWTLAFTRPDGLRFVATVERSRLPTSLPPPLGGDRVTRAGPDAAGPRLASHPGPLRTIEDVEAQAREELGTQAAPAAYLFELETSGAGLYPAGQPDWIPDLLFLTARIWFEGDLPLDRPTPQLEISLLTERVLSIQYALN